MIVLLCLLNAFAVATSLDVVLLSDIHYDAYYLTSQAFNPHQCSRGQVAGQVGCDSPHYLLNAVAQDIRSATPDFVFMMGDWLRHDAAELTTSQINASFATVATALAPLASRTVVPAPTLQLTLGNNDFVPDYTFDTGLSSHPLLQLMTTTLAASGLLDSNEAALFQYCGSYNRSVAGIRIITLNTVVWSSSLTPPVTSPDPCGLFSFLRNQLANARLQQERVVIVGHIPPITEMYGLLNEGLSCTTCDYYKDAFRVEYLSIVFANRDIVITQLFGHTHTFGFVASSEVGVPMFIVPAVSPVYTNNPAYMMGRMNSTNGLTSLVMRYTPVGQTDWHNLSDVATLLQIRDLSFDELRRAALSVRSNDGVFNAFSLLHSGWMSTSANIPADCGMGCRAIISCAMLYTSSADVAQCASVSFSSGLHAIVVIFIVLSVVIVVATVAYLMLHLGELRRHKKAYEDVELNTG